MVEKLKLVHELIPWSLVAKGLIFAASWLLFPYLLFIVVAAFLFFSPPFQAARFFPLFVFLFWLSYIFPPAPREAIFLSILFLTALGIKNLVFIDRIFASQVFLVSSSFLLWLSLFMAAPRPSFFFLVSSILVSSALFILFRFVSHLQQSDRLAPAPLFLMALLCFLSVQLAWVLVLLPAEPASQALFMALFMAFSTEIFFSYLNHSLTKPKIRVIALATSLATLILIISLPFTLTP